MWPRNVVSQSQHVSWTVLWPKETMEDLRNDLVNDPHDNGFCTRSITCIAVAVQDVISA